MSDWVEGGPVEDGLYACEPDGGRLMYVLRIKDGVKMWTDGDTNVRYRRAVRRYYRLPEPQPPLKPLRRFTAKYRGHDIVGVETRKVLGTRDHNLYCETKSQQVWLEESDLTDLQWIDEP